MRAGGIAILPPAHERRVRRGHDHVGPPWAVPARRGVIDEEVLLLPVLAAHPDVRGYDQGSRGAEDRSVQDRAAGGGRVSGAVRCD